jgi:glycine cleavage system pyridoxal-binding protein P
LNEFAIRVPDARTVHRRLLDAGVLAGLVLADAEPDDPSLVDGLLVCATEVTTSAEIAQFAGALSAVLGHTDIPVAAR